MTFLVRQCSLTMQLAVACLLVVVHQQHQQVIAFQPPSSSQHNKVSAVQPPTATRLQYTGVSAPESSQLLYTTTGTSAAAATTTTTSAATALPVWKTTTVPEPVEIGTAVQVVAAVLPKQQQQLLLQNKQPLQRRKRMQRFARQHGRVVAPSPLSTATTPTTSATTTTTTDRSFFNTQKTKQQPPKKKGLTRQQEVSYSFQIRTFRAAVRLRDQVLLEQRKTAAATAATTNDGQRAATTTTTSSCNNDFLTEQAWAAACGVSVIALRRVLYEGQQARAAIQQANTGLVMAVAYRHYHAVQAATSHDRGVGSILTVQDMIQEGNLGLMEAAERFEPEKGFRFSTYATWWVRQRILRSISDSSRTIRLPAHVHSTLQKIHKTKTALSREQGREPSLPELALHLEMTEEKLQMYTDSSRNVVSLEAPLRNGGSLKEDRRTLGDTLASDAPTPLEDAEAEHLRRDISATIEALADSERQVIVQRFGLGDGKPKTVAETAERLNISRDRVRLVEARALNKLRHPQRNYRLKEYVGGDTCTMEVKPEVEAQAPHSDRLWFF